MPGDVKSKAQAAFLGSVIAGKNKKEGPSKEEARKMLRGADVANLPEYAGKRKTMRERLKNAGAASKAAREAARKKREG